MDTDRHRPRPGHQALRRGRISQPGQIYHVTTTSAGREPLFLNLALARLVIRRLHDRELIGDTTNLCWVLMPDHLHWLLQLGNEPGLSTLLRRFKALTSLDINRQLGRHGVSVWQPSFHDHALRGDEDVETVARYIVANPMRAGLCESPAEYSHWDAMWEWEW